MPLAQVLLASETLSLGRERDEAERRTLVDSIVRETRRLVALVENVLMFSRSGSVALAPRMEAISVALLFDDAGEAVRLAVADAGQSLEIAAVTEVVLADRRLITQALVNVIDNAIKYGRRGGTIRLGASIDEVSRIRLHVDDDGPGVPRADRERVFDAYERLGEDQTSERTGTGLGLAVARGIVRACGGRMWIDETPRGGARVVIELRSA